MTYEKSWSQILLLDSRSVQSFTVLLIFDIRVLQEHKRNKLKDFLTMAPALQVSHLMAISLTDIAPSLRIARLPSGPTFSFRIERYSLKKDLLKASRSSRSQGLEYLTAPLVRRHILSVSILFVLIPLVA